jgi:hypothetical protein
MEDEDFEPSQLWSLLSANLARVLTNNELSKLLRAFLVPCLVNTMQAPYFTLLLENKET